MIDYIALPPLPPAGFDPVRRPADRARLAEFWLPSMPDREQEPGLHHIWRRMFERRPRHVVADCVAHRPRPAPVPPIVPPPVPAQPVDPVLPGMHQCRRRTSPNWTGFHAYPGRGDRFTRVAGSWQAPDVAVGHPGDANGVAYRCSIWIGIDGKRPWARSMPQIGSEHTAGEGARLWWQWWTPDSLRLQHYLTNMEVGPGDEILADVSVRDDLHVRFHVVNRSQGVATTFEVTGERPLAGSSAQWVLERPADPVLPPGGKLQRGLFHPMPDFGRVAIEGFAARGVVPGREASPRAYALRPARAAANLTIRPGPRRIRVVAVPEHAGGRALAVTYQRGG